MKELNINSVVYCYYKIEDNIIFINIQKQFINKTLYETENFCIYLIQILENKQFRGASFLNLRG